jgi:hypothetical protein
MAYSPTPGLSHVLGKKKRFFIVFSKLHLIIGGKKLGRARKPVEELKRQRKGRGYETNTQVHDIQQEIFLQYNKIKSSLANIDPIQNTKEYKSLLDALLRIEKQTRTFSTKYDDRVLELKDLIEGLGNE